MKFYKCKSDRQTLENMRKSIKDSNFKLGIPEIDKHVTFYKGAVYSFAAPTNTGKTTFLIALAKLLAARFKVLYISTDEDPETLIDYFPTDRNITLAYQSSSEDKIDADLVKGFDIVIYDYLGSISPSLDNEWQALRVITHNLHNLAQEMKITIFTAHQLKTDIYDVSITDPSRYRPDTYNEFSKSISNELDGVFLMTQDETKGSNQLIITIGKIRRQKKYEHEMRVGLNFETKTIEAPRGKKY